jgi:hypothetical protein
MHTTVATVNQQGAISVAQNTNVDRTVMNENVVA